MSRPAGRPADARGRASKTPRGRRRSGSESSSSAHLTMTNCPGRVRAACSRAARVRRKLRAPRSRISLIFTFLSNIHRRSIESKCRFATPISVWYDRAASDVAGCKPMIKKVDGKLLMTAEEMDLALARIAAEIVEKHGPRTEFAIIGIRRRGVFLAERLSKKVADIRKQPTPSGILDITLYRDDLTTVSHRPLLRETSIDFDINNLSLVLVDDVLYTGRTIRAALDGLVDLGRPRRVQLAVLVDRGHRELPGQADDGGKDVQTDGDEIVEVRMREEDADERVALVKRAQKWRRARSGAHRAGGACRGGPIECALAQRPARQRRALRRGDRA